MFRERKEGKKAEKKLRREEGGKEGENAGGRRKWKEGTKENRDRREGGRRRERDILQ